MRSEMINRVAEALWQEHKKKAFPDMRDLAIAAIEAMREPTPHMVNIGHVSYAHATGATEWIARDCYGAMINAALKGNNSE